MKTTPKEKMIINLMEEVINILSTCEHLSDPEFAMYEVMKDAVDKEVYYPLYDQWTKITTFNKSETWVKTMIVTLNPKYLMTLQTNFLMSRVSKNCMTF